MKNLSFSTDGADTIMKERETSTNPRTPAQSANRNYFSLSSKGYSSLSAANLALWKSYAQGQTFVGRKGKKPYTPNAFEAYKHLTQVWYAANAGVGTPPVTPPTTSFVGDNISIVATASAGEITFAGSSRTTPGTVLEIRIQRLSNANRKPSASGYRIAAYASLTPAGGNQTTVSVPPGIYAAQYCFIDQATGQRTPLVSIEVGGVALGLTEGGAESAKKASAVKKAA